jgi:hypothetical protein
MTHKTKVIAVRVTQKEYEAFAFYLAFYNKKASDVFKISIEGAISHGQELLIQAEKKAEAKAKRDAKKAEKNGL